MSTEESPTSPTPTTGYGQPTTTPAGYPAPEPNAPRVSTVVWGLVLVALGIGVVGAAAGATIDVGLAAIVLLAGAGVALLIGSLIAAARRTGS
jgi:hypothetical protein